MPEIYQDMRSEQYYQQFQQQQYPPQPPRKRSLAWLWITLIVLVVLAALIWWISTLPRRVYGGFGNPEAAAEIAEPYLAALYVEGDMTVYDDGDYLPGYGGYGGYRYDHQYLLDTIDALMADDLNAGLVLYVDSPGGQVLAADELGRRVAEYQQATGRPVYAYGYNYAASGGYWIMATADRIILNQYGITGSIGVTMGNLIDLTGLLENYGVKTYNLASGGEKNAVNGLTPISGETVAVYQSIVNEYYENFLDWVAAGRDMDKEALRPLADGRPYTAKQALENGLIDGIGDYQDALDQMMEQTGVSNVYDYYPESSAAGLMHMLFGSAREQSELNTILGLLPPGGVLAYYDGTW